MSVKTLPMNMLCLKPRKCCVFVTVFHNNAILRQVSLNVVKIPTQSTVKHVGNVLMHNLHDEADIHKKGGTP